MRDHFDGRGLGKALLLISCFFLIILSYSIIKPIRNSLFVTHLGAEYLPYVWIVTAVTMLFTVAAYGKLIDTISRKWVMSISTLFFLGTLIALRMNMNPSASPLVSGLFYVWSDIYVVVLIEQVWSLSNDLFTVKDAKKFYGMISAGSILGGISGGAVTAWFSKTLGTENLIYVCIGVLFTLSFLLLFTNLIGRNGKKKKSKFTTSAMSPNPDFLEGFKLIIKSKYLTYMLIALTLTQVISTIIDYQFNTAVQAQFSEMNDRTAFFGKFIMAVNVSSLVVTFLLTAPIHKKYGIFAGLLVLPLFNLFGALLYVAAPLAMVIFTFKVLDKSLNYSINRASKEQLYVPTSKQVKFKAKAVIDMFGYRFSKIIGSVFIIAAAPFLSVTALSLINLVLISGLLYLVYNLMTEYFKLTEGNEHRELERFLTAAKGFLTVPHSKRRT